MASPLESPLVGVPQPVAAEVADRSSSDEYGTVAVIGKQYCLPYTVELVVTEKLLSPTHADYLITDANGNAIFTVKGVMCSLRGRRILYDVAGMPVLTMQRKILTLHRRYEVFKGDNAAEARQVRLFSAKLASLVQFNTELNVFLDSNTDEDTCDFKIVGDLFERSCGIYHGHSSALIAQMHKMMNVKDLMLGKDTFGVTVYPNVDYAFIVALIVLLDGIHTDQLRSRRNRRQNN